MAEHPPDHGRHLEDSFQILAESVDTCEQHALDRGWDVQGRQGARQAVACGLLHQVAALQEGEGQLFDEQRVPIRLGDNESLQLGRERRYAQQILHHRLALFRGQALQRHPRGVGLGEDRPYHRGTAGPGQPRQGNLGMVGSVGPGVQIFGAIHQDQQHRDGDHGLDDRREDFF